MSIINKSKKICVNTIFLFTEIGEYCRLTSNCQVEKTTCQKGQCRCFYGFHPNYDKTRCLKSIKLNEKCYSDEECVVDASGCLGGMCRCKNSHVPSEDGQSCLPLATSLYQPCQQDSQCTSIPFSYCADNSTCICINDYHDINSVRIINNSSSDDHLVSFEISFNFFQRCWSSVVLNGICESDENCVIAHSSCRNKRCSCDEEYVEVSHRGSKFCSNAERVQISFLVVLVFIISSRLL